jgi:serine/threonine protein kinase/Tol biopolymer transport system component
MTSGERWRQIERLYHAALEREASLRPQFLRDACAGDQDLLQEVESLLALEAQAEGFLEEGAIDLAAGLLGQHEARPVDRPLAGQTVSHYRILEKLGEGGMGVVYKAEDLKLGRLAALKFLPEFPFGSDDKTVLARLEREACTASALNHPNIITIYDISSDSGHDFIAMEYVDGQTLQQAIPKRGLPLNQALLYGIQIAGALARAHSAGITHRDLKPSNVMVDKHGAIKVLDFGLAKLTGSSGPGEEDPARTPQPLTEQGAIVGTMAYMSPEQAEGKPVDARSDIFSFGSLLYEMVTGRRAFQGDTKASTLAAVITKDPAASSAPIPYDLEKIINRCLRKQPERRFQHMDDVRVALEELKEDSDSGKLAAPATVPRARPRSWIRLASILSFLLVLAVGLAWWLWPTPAVQGPLLRRLTFDSGLSADPALSSDGKLLAYASDRSGEGNLDIWVQQIAGGEPMRLTRDPSDDSEPSFSPDGSKVAFRSERAGGGIYVVSALGGEARLLVKEGRSPRFSPSGDEIAYWTGNPNDPGAGKIFVVPVSGAGARQVAAESPGAAKPVWLPDGKHLAFAGMRESREYINVAALDGNATWQTGLYQVLQDHHLSPVGRFPTVCPAAGNRWIFGASLGDSVNLWQVAVSPGKWLVAGIPQRLTSGAGLESQPSADSGGRVAFVGHRESSHIWRLPVVANEGKITGELQQLTRGEVSDIWPYASSSGKRIVFVSNRTGSNQVWQKDLDSGKEVALTATRNALDEAIITRDGTRVAYAESIDGKRWTTYVVPATGAGVPEKVCDDCGYVEDWSPDGTRILGGRQGESGSIFWLLDLPSGKKIELLRDPKRILYQGRFSPDGRWICFRAVDATNGNRLMIAPFRPSEIPSQEWIAVTGYTPYEGKPRWSPNGNLLYFSSMRDGFRCIWAQPLDPGTKLPQGRPFAVYHSHDPHRSLSILEEGRWELWVARDALIFAMGERTGNIWLAEWKDRR